MLGTLCISASQRGDVRCWTISANVGRFSLTIESQLFMKRGVLSEDGIWNLLEDHREVNRRMQQLLSFNTNK